MSSIKNLPVDPAITEIFNRFFDGTPVSAEVIDTSRGDDDFRNTIREGIAKVNIFTDLCLAGDIAMKASEDEEIGYLKTRNVKVNVIKEVVKNKIRLFGSEGKA